MSAVYARSDLAYVFVSEAHGGCGEPHRRPVEHGAPVHPWILGCEPCADHLRHDPHWSSTTAEIPETYDESKSREDFEKRGAKDKDAVLTLALARLAGIDSSELPASLTRMISGVPAHIPAQLECPNGHGQPSGMKFCGECGAAMHGSPAKAALNAPQQPAESSAKTSGGQRQRRLRDARLDELQALAKVHGLDETGNRSDLIARLSAAGVTNNDLARLPSAA